MSAAVILAAGASRRLGRPKQLEVREGETLVHRVARLALAAGWAPVLVVTGCRGDEVEAAVRDLAVTPLRNPDWEEGMASSLRAGVEGLPSHCDGALILLCDQLFRLILKT